jgi:hypothetical protein
MTQPNLLLTPEAVQQYLVASVKKWRQLRQEAHVKGAANDAVAALCYIDAFQSVHTTLFGTPVPEAT